jgi:serine/threonine-protein kinase
MQGGEAAGLLQALGFIASQRPVYDELVRPGEVVGSDPAAGNRAVPGAPVAVLVSNGPAPHVVPAIVGQPEAQGMAELGRSGVGLGDVTTKYVAGSAPGVVLSTDPVPGSSVPRDFPIDVVISAPPASLTVPSVTGLLQASAKSILQPMPFTVSYRSRTVPYGDARAGRILSQSIPPGTTVDPQTPLQLVVGVAAAPPTTTTTVPVGPTTPTTPTPPTTPTR